MKRLSNATIASLPQGIERPAYDRSHVTAGIVHLGIGAFHRAHQAVYIDSCLATGQTAWGIRAASLRSAETRNALTPQDGLFSLSERGPQGISQRVIGSIMDVLVAPEAPHALLNALVDPGIRLVTLTITEKGYTTDLGSGTVHFDHPDVIHDLAHPDSPRSALGFLTEAIARRRAAGADPFTLLSCDNLPTNGATLHRALCAFAQARESDLARYIEDEIASPSCMVDRIVPATTEADRDGAREALDLIDAWPVVTEPFHQWVIEDRFPVGRPRLEDHGAEFVGDVRPFEHMKLRLLNGAHSTLAACGRLAGKATVSEAIADPAIRALIERLWDELRPTLSIGTAESAHYTNQLLERFSNPSLPHRTAQIASDASQKVPQRLVAALRELRRGGRPDKALVFAIAAFLRSCGGIDDAGRSFSVNDPALAAWPDAPDQSAASPQDVVTRFLGLASIFGTDLPRESGFSAALTQSYSAIARFGVQAAITEMLQAS